MSDKNISIEWSEVYTDSLPYSMWHKEASKGLRPPIGLVLHGSGDVPRYGVGEGQVLLASNDRDYITARLDEKCGLAVDGKMLTVEDVFNPDRNVTAEIIGRAK